MMLKTLVIIPAFNERECIENTIKEVQSACPEVDLLVVNDCSEDDTADILRRLRVPFLDLPVNLGIGGAVQAGYRYALEKGYEAAIQLDGDGQHDPRYLTEMVKTLETGDADIVIGSRFLEKEGFQSSGARRAGIRFLDRLSGLCSGVNVTDCTSGFRAVSAEYIRLYAGDYPVDYPEPEAIVQAALQGARIREIPVVMRERKTGSSSIRPLHSVYYMTKVSLAILLLRLGGKRA